MTSKTAQRREANQELHPTKEELIRTVVTMLDELTLDEITSEKVLDLSGVSRGSLYHHFEDFSELLELAQVRRFSGYVNHSIMLLNEVFTSVNSREELLEKLAVLSRSLHSPEFRENRLERITTISKVKHNARMAKALGQVQDKLTERLSDLYSDLQVRGLANPNLKPRTAAVMFQAYGLGRVVDDFTENQVEQENWLYAVSLISENVFFPVLN